MAEDLPGPAPAGEARPRPSRPFAGSLRQRRGQLLAQVITQGAVPVANADREAAGGLLADGLIRLADGQLCAPD